MALIPPEFLGMIDLLCSSKAGFGVPFQIIETFGLAASFCLLLSIASFPELFMLLAVTVDTLRIFLLLASVLPSCGQGAVGDVIACSCAGCYLLARKEVPPT